MEYLRYIAIIILIALIIIRMMPVKGINHITTEELKEERKKKDKQFIDVRTPREFKTQHIQPFQNIPLNKIGRRAPKELDKNKETVVICQTGIRSQRAAKNMKKRICTNINYVHGDISTVSKVNILIGIKPEFYKQTTHTVGQQVDKMRKLPSRNRWQALAFRSNKNTANEVPVVDPSSSI